jgi:flavin-dependent dehydrogenase
VIPYLRELGVEDEVRTFATYKPGASFVFSDDEELSFRFDEVRKARTTYAYNVPRDRFDAALLAAAVKSGAQLVAQPARVERDLAGGDAGAAGERVRLDAASLAAAGLERQPDSVVDAGGRARLLARLLDLPTVAGDRRDTALHAHLRGVPLLHEGHVHTDRLSRGWCWRIPLPDRVSVGLVVPSEHIAGFGPTLEEQYDNFLRADPLTRAWAARAERLTPVVRYTNYQLRTLRGLGPNWALAGDAFGFIDPVFSSGLAITFEGAALLARALLDGTRPALERWEQRVLRLLAVWQRLAGYYYDGRFFTLVKVGSWVRRTIPGRLMDWHFAKHMPRILTGESTTSPYSVGLLEFMIRYGLARNDPARLAVR